MNHREALEVMRRQHDIFNGLASTDMILVSCDQPGRTDTKTFVGVPIEDPEAPLIHKHEWSHKFGKTNLYSRARFIQECSRELVQGFTLPLDPEVVARLLGAFCAVLDDLRVNSLWARVYPGSAQEIEDRWRRLLTRAGVGADPALYMMAINAGVWTESKWDRYAHLFLSSGAAVRGRGYTSVLVEARRLVIALIQDLPPASGADLQAFTGEHGVETLARNRRPRRTEPDKVITKMAGSLSPTELYADTPTPPASPDPEPEKTEREVNAALGKLNADQTQYVLEESRLEVESFIHSVRSSVRFADDDKALLGHINRTSFVDLAAGEVEETPLAPHDSMVVGQLRTRFQRLMQSRKERMEDQGTDLDPQRYIDYLLSGDDPCFFRDEAISRGFSALLLLDMSGSMQARWETVSRACKIVVTAMKFPFVEFKVWGFTSTNTGDVTIMRFQDAAKGYSPKKRHPALWGLTPLHLVMPIGVRQVRKMAGGAEHLFVITDGNPQHVGSSHDVLKREVKGTVEAARRMGVQVSSLIIGHEVTNRDANMMYGAGHWERVEDKQESLLREIVALVERSFSRFIRR